MTSVCTVVLCGAPLTSRAVDLIEAIQGAGWTVRVAATAAAAEWIDEAGLRSAVGHTPRTSYRDPEYPGGPARPDAIVVAPMTFNTLNKLATGIADTYVSTLLCLAVSQRTPLVAVPMFSQNLGGHPAAANSMLALRDLGVRFVDPVTGADRVEPFAAGSDPDVVAGFDPAWVVERLPVPAPNDPVAG